MERVGKRHRSKVEREVMVKKVNSLLANYKCIDFCFYVRTYVFSLPRRHLITLLALTESWAASHDIPSRISLLVKDLIAFKIKSTGRVIDYTCGEEKKDNRGHMTVLFHNKGIEMIDLPKIVHYKSVRKAVPGFLNEPPPAVVGYKYTKTISSMIFNQKSVVKELDVDNGTKDIKCSCSSSDFCYGPAGHVVTGDLRIIKDAKLRELVNKGPSYREQNNIDWILNARICKEAVTKYKVKWSRRLRIDKRVLNEWEKKVHEAIDRRVQLLRSKQIKSMSYKLRSTLIICMIFRDNLF